MGAGFTFVTLHGLAILAALAPAPVTAVRPEGSKSRRDPENGVFQRLHAQERAELARRVGRPEAIAPLAALIRLEEHLPPGHIDEDLRALVEDARTDPLVAAQAEYRLALGASRRGDPEGANRRYQALGLLSEFQVVGPFEAQGRGALMRVLPPETAEGRPGHERRFPGKEREVAWRGASRVVREGALAFDALLRPDNDAVAYALTYLQSDRRRVAVLRVGSPGPIKVWLGGKLVLERNVVREARLDQDAATVVLEPGENPLLVKSVVLGSAWRLFVRVTDTAGRPLPRLSSSPSGTSYPPWATRPAPAAGRARELSSILRSRAERSRGRARASAWLDYGRYLGFSRAADRDAREIERALGEAAEAGAGTTSWLLLGELAHEEDERRRALERAAAEAMKPDERALALAQLGLLSRASQRESAAFALLRAALTADPACLPAVLALAAEEQLAGLAAAALARLEALPAHLGSLHLVRVARARALEALGRRGDADRSSRPGRPTSSWRSTWPARLACAAIRSGPSTCTPSWRGSGPISPLS
jgi:hypothetical protein